ncbi:MULTISPECIES: 6-phosphogluconolactonase [Pandoraea]|uniref:6-phosphogluconolactonase n=1 Tax=Pandoraea cepalis TaxID=2508294 RepID=A0A5E4W9P0_9BURK|nr:MULTISPECIES: 6-phosphogluconolactonase [Pandoraea]QBC30894.1 6-phosphogluconolactonase [Pandoraea sp. XY-2]VVE21338.1 6-phosphogluconolactonase [Pandoraea cepalis]
MIHWRTFPTRQAQALALANAVVARLDEALTIRPRALLAVSGGTSPKAFLLQLARLPVAWRDVDITLVDDRWLPPTHAQSNARLVAETLLPGATGAHWLPLVDTATSAALQVRTLNDTWRHGVPQVAVLGMGEDGHTASLFADAAQWHDAIATHDKFVLVQPQHAPHLRVSWSLAALASCERLLLQIQGPAKRAVFEAAQAEVQDNAISRLIHCEGVNIDVFWSEE